MNRIPTAALIRPPQAVEVVDQRGSYLYRIHVGVSRVIAANLNGMSLSVGLANGQTKVFSLAEGRSPVLTFTR